MARIFGKHHRVKVVALCASTDEIITGNEAYLRHRRSGATGEVCGGVGDTYLVRHDFDHSIGAYTGAELAEIGSTKEPHGDLNPLPAPA